MESLQAVLMRRDGLSESEALERCEEAAEFVAEAAGEGDLMAIGEYFLSEFGLEPDYAEEFIFNM